MGNISRLLIVGLAAVVLCGCAAQKYRNQADDFYERGNMEQAARLYRQALREKNSYRRNDDFMARYNHASSRDAYRQAKLLEGGDLFEKAVARYAEALKFDRQYTEARQALEQANRLAARKRYEQALGAADLGDLKQAEDHLRIALRYDPHHAAAQAALNHLGAASVRAPTDPLYHQALSDNRERRWARAKRKLEELLAANPNHLSARVVRHEADQQIAASNTTTGRAEQQLQAKRLQQAVGTLEAALAVWPYNTRALGLLNDTKSLLTSVEKLYEAAKQLLADEKWESATLAAEKGLEVYPYHEGLQQVRREVGEKAARQYNRRGDAALQNRQYEQAAGAYHAALRYQPSNSHAKKGLANIYLQLADTAEQAGQPGAALVYHLLANDHDASGSGATFNRRRSDAIHRADASVALALAGPAETTGHTQQIAAALSSDIPKNAPQAVRVVTAANSRYLIEVAVTGAQVSQRLVSRQQHVYQYAVESTVINPVPDKLRHGIHYISNEIDDLKDRAAARARFERQRLANLDPPRQYNPERDPQYQRTWDRIKQLRRRRDHMTYRLRHEPSSVVVSEARGHPYAVLAYEKKAVMQLSVTLKDRAGGNVLRQWSASDQITVQDTATENAAPRIGLPADPLALPDDAQLLDDLREKMQAPLAEPIARQIVSERARQLRHAADAERRAGRQAQALERQVESAMLLNTIGPNTAKPQIESLIAQLRIRPAIESADTASVR